MLHLSSHSLIHPSFITLSSLCPFSLKLLIFQLQLPNFSPLWPSFNYHSTFSSFSSSSLIFPSVILPILPLSLFHHLFTFTSHPFFLWLCVFLISFSHLPFPNLFFLFPYPPFICCFPSTSSSPLFIHLFPSLLLSSALFIIPANNQKFHYICPYFHSLWKEQNTNELAEEVRIIRSVRQQHSEGEIFSLAASPGAPWTPRNPADRIIIKCHHSLVRRNNGLVLSFSAQFSLLGQTAV